MDSSFRVGSWVVEPGLNTVSSNGRTIRLEPKVMEVLVCLARHAGESLTKEKLLQEVWPGAFVTDDALTRCILELRRAFEDDAREPRVIQTIAKRGYRLVAPVEPINGIENVRAESPNAVSPGAAGSRGRKRWISGLAGSLALLLVLLTVLNRVAIRERLLGSRGVPSIRSLAVLPLQNLSADPTQEYFSDGMTDALITDLAQIDSLKVISRTSSMQYKQTRKSLPEIARELNVDGIVEGTVQRSGNRIRITAQLIHGPSDDHRWANSYERDMSDVFALERDVTEDIARQIETRITSEKQAVLAQPRPVSPEVLEAYLQGKYHLSRYGEGAGEQELTKATEYFQQVVDDDPNFAPAYIGLAFAHTNLSKGSSEDIAIVRRAAEKAAELDPNNSDARFLLGAIKWQPGLDWRGAEEEFRRAIALNPNNSAGHAGLCQLLIVLGHVDEGLRECKIAQQLDPRDDNSSLGLYLGRDYDGSIVVLRVMLQRDPNNAFSHCYMFLSYYKKGMEKEALEEIAQCYSLFGLTEVGTHMRQAFAVSGLQGAMRHWTKDVEHLQAIGQVYLPGNLAYAYTILGDKDHAFYWLEQAYEHREMVSADGGVFYLAADPMYDPLRSDPRFKDLLRRVGLPQ